MDRGALRGGAQDGALKKPRPRTSFSPVPMPAPSIRSLAARLNLSHATVSEALRGSLRVKEETRRRVTEEAERMGYRLDPIASEVMARMRRSRTDAFRGVIALVAAEDDALLAPVERRRRVLLRQGAARRAAECGFKIDPVCVGADEGAWARVAGVLHTRNVAGALLLPSDRCRVAHRALLGRAEYPAAYADSPEEGAEHIDAVAPDYRQALALARVRLAALGYVRPGLVLSGRPDSPRNLRWLAAADVVRPNGLSAERASVLWADSETLSSSFALARWKREHAVDVLLSEDELPAGLDLPSRLLDCSGKHAASGLDLRWDEIAARAVDGLARQYFDRLRGRRESPALVSLPARWRGIGAGLADPAEPVRRDVSGRGFPVNVAAAEETAPLAGAAA